MAALSVEPENLRTVIVVDDDINIFNDSDVMWAIGTRFDATDDLTILKNGAVLADCYRRTGCIIPTVPAPHAHRAP